MLWMHRNDPYLIWFWSGFADNNKNIEYHHICPFNHLFTLCHSSTIILFLHTHSLTELGLIEFPFTADIINSSHGLRALDSGIWTFLFSYSCLTAVLFLTDSLILLYCSSWVFFPAFVFNPTAFRSIAAQRVFNRGESCCRITVSDDIFSPVLICSGGTLICQPVRRCWTLWSL